MKWFFISPFSINVLNISILIFFMIGFLSLKKEKSTATLFLDAFLGGVGLVFVSFFIIFSSLNPSYSTFAWWAIHLMVFASIPMVQFAYYFPENLHPAESRMVLNLSVVAAVLVYPYYIFRTVSMEPVYSFEGFLYAYFNTPEIGFVIGAEIIWMIVVFFRKCHDFSGWKDSDPLDAAKDNRGSKSGTSQTRRGLHWLRVICSRICKPGNKQAKALRNLALVFISPVALIFVIVMAYKGLLSWAVVAHILGTAFMVVVFLFIVLYINNSSEPSTFMIKLIGISLGIILIVFGIVSNITLLIKEESYEKSRLFEIEQCRKAVSEDDYSSMPAKLSYLIVFSHENNAAGREAVDVLFLEKDLEISGLMEFLKRFRAQQGTREPSTTPGVRTRGFRAMDIMKPDSFFKTFGFVHEGRSFEAGFSYVEYRRILHETGIKLVWIILGCVLFTLIILPFFFRESLVKPLDRLLDGVRKVNGGDLAAVVPVGVEDEIGFLSRSFNSMVASIREGEKKLKDSLEYQVRLTESYSFFIPKEFLEFLKKESIVDIKLGDNVQEEMTILFSDIRSFTMLSERMSPQENFNFLNSCLKRVGPVVRANNGFIDKYIGDAIMALFPRRPDDAVEAAVDIQRVIASYNKERVAKGYDPVEIGTGMHTGALMLGTIGEEKRMESTVISDAVNLAARVESLTKLYGATVILSDVTMGRLEKRRNFEFRYLDRVRVKGKRSWVDIFEVLDSETPGQREMKLRTRHDFDRAVECYRHMEMNKALELFTKVAETNQEDRAAHLYIKRCGYFQKFGIPEQWEGVTALDDEL